MGMVTPCAVAVPYRVSFSGTGGSGSPCPGWGSAPLLVPTLVASPLQEAAEPTMPWICFPSAAVSDVGHQNRVKRPVFQGNNQNIYQETQGGTDTWFGKQVPCFPFLPSRNSQINDPISWQTQTLY